jgi:hypothetical protein
LTKNIQQLKDIQQLQLNQRPAFNCFNAENPAWKQKDKPSRLT